MNFYNKVLPPAEPLILIKSKIILKILFENVYHGKN